jgi:histidinol-phosphate/aromatic aminotransferase/cobyric acid decarboxylase-like protein
MSEASVDTATFAEFVAWRHQVEAVNPDVRQICETRIAPAFAAICPQIEIPPSFTRVHRCDLAKRWRAVKGMDFMHPRTILICEGVRHGLEQILKLMALGGLRVALPLDVYPVYGRIAEQAAVDAVGVSTFPDFNLSRILGNVATSGASYVLLPYPLKLHGRSWAADETAAAIAWLGERSERRLMLDGVYAFGEPVDAQLRQLLATDQVIYLDSLSKGWLHEKVLGVAAVPERDIDIYSEAFRNLCLSQPKLFVARGLLGKHDLFPAELTKEIQHRREALSKILAKLDVRTLPATRGYLLAIQKSASRLLAEHDLLTIPASAFGCRLHDWSIASALGIENYL